MALRLKDGAKGVAIVDGARGRVARHVAWGAGGKGGKVPGIFLILLLLLLVPHLVVLLLLLLLRRSKRCQERRGQGGEPSRGKAGGKVRSGQGRRALAKIRVTAGQLRQIKP